MISVTQSQPQSKNTKCSLFWGMWWTMVQTLLGYKSFFVPCIHHEYAAQWESQCSSLGYQTDLWCSSGCVQVTSILINNDPPKGDWGQQFGYAQKILCHASFDGKLSSQANKERLISKESARQDQQWGKSVSEGKMVLILWPVSDDRVMVTVSLSPQLLVSLPPMAQA